MRRFLEPAAALGYLAFSFAALIRGDRVVALFVTAAAACRLIACHFEHEDVADLSRRISILEVDLDHVDPCWRCCVRAPGHDPEECRAS